MTLKSWSQMLFQKVQKSQQNMLSRSLKVIFLANLNVSADQDGSHLCPYLSSHFVVELALYPTILYSMAT